MIDLVDINEDNFHSVIQLELEDYQMKFVAPNVRSLAEYYLYRKMKMCFHMQFK